MGVDYTGHYGLGFKVTLPEFAEDNEFHDDPIGFLHAITEKTDFSFFEVGEGNYSGEDNDLFIIIDEPFSNGLDITDNANKLKDFLVCNQISFEGEIDTVGGLEVW